MRRRIGNLVALAAVICGGMLQSPAATAADASFTLSSSAVAEGSDLPVYAVCPGKTTIPVSWANPPAGTKSYALLMDTVDKDNVTSYYWVVYDIPVKARSLPQGSTKIGYLGGNSKNRDIGYAPPCSQGPGTHEYTIRLFALSKKAPLSTLPKVSSSDVSGQMLLNAIANIKLGEADLHVTATHL